MSLQGASICCWGCSDVTFGIAVCTDGWCGAFVLLGGVNGLFASRNLHSIGLDGPELVGSTASWMNFPFLVYLAHELVWTW